MVTSNFSVFECVSTNIIIAPECKRIPACVCMDTTRQRWRKLSRARSIYLGLWWFPLILHANAVICTYQCRCAENHLYHRAFKYKSYWWRYVLISADHQHGLLDHIHGKSILRSKLAISYQFFISLDFKSFAVCSLFLFYAARQSCKNAYFSVWEFQHAMQNKNLLFTIWKTGKSICHQFAINMQDMLIDENANLLLGYLATV